MITYIVLGGPYYEQFVAGAFSDPGKAEEFRVLIGGCTLPARVVVDDPDLLAMISSNHRPGDDELMARTGLKP